LVLFNPGIWICPKKCFEVWKIKKAKVSKELQNSSDIGKDNTTVEKSK
jgi:hypothetical protein